MLALRMGKVGGRTLSPNLPVVTGSGGRCQHVQIHHYPGFWGDCMWQALATSVLTSRALEVATLVPPQLQFGGDTYGVQEAPWSWKHNQGQLRFASQGGIIS